MTKHTYFDFLDQYTKGFDETGVLRDGQRAMNLLHDMNYPLCAHLAATELDPFHSDRVLPLFFGYVAENWDRKDLPADGLVV